MLTKNFRFSPALLVCASIFALLSGCGGSGGDSPASATSSTGSTGSSAPTATITLSGTPPTSVIAGDQYVFQPTASASAGAPTFSASGLPSWASINSSTGEISGTPTSSNVGMSGDIIVSASDGNVVASMAPFKINVMAAAAVTGSASLSWTVPTLNTNGTPVTDLAGYHIYYGTAPGALNTMIDVPGANTTQYEISNLSSGTYYFAVAAYNSMGIDSADSNEGSKTI
jgi:hypothetical protein